MMKPPARIASHRRRLILALALCPAAAFPASPVDQACRVTVVEDPRLEALRKADPDDPHIDITSDQGDMSRVGDAELSGAGTTPPSMRISAASGSKARSSTSTRRFT
jgi:hypothetical protein